ncbi:hypothetical protein [Staphylospora marina]|uniref:pPIWI_RE_Z domain-containing protein n=1 Tax=Staphylospora marina TaxID=2490858 RepID=UPI000F5BE29D|nr:hypothetical protein [Staphylospora marina]
MNRFNVFEWLCELTSKEYVERMFPDKKAVRRMLAVEFVLFAMHEHKLDAWFPLEDGEVFASGWHKLYAEHDSIRRVAERIRVLTRGYQLKKWKDWLGEYQQIPRNYRLFDVHIGSRTKLEKMEFSPVSCSDREWYYRMMLEQEIPCVPVRIKLAERGKTYDYLRGQAAIPVKIPEGLQTTALKTGVLPRTKKTGIKMRNDLGPIGREMDGRLQDKGKKPVYEERLKNIELVPLSPDQSFEYANILHILGGLGAGKSTFVTAQAYALAVYEGAKVGIVETRVDDVLDKARELRDLGLRVVTFVGKSERAEYEKRIMANQSIEQLIDDQRLEDVSSFCAIHALAGDHTPSDRYPCTSLNLRDQESNRKKNRQFMCPLWNQCGLYHHYHELEQADVYIATPAALVHMMAPPQRFPRKTVYELFYELTDVVFVDEADHVQYNLDQAFMMEIPLVGDPDTLVEKVLQKVIRQTSGIHKKVVDEYINATMSFVRAARAVYRVVESNARLRNRLKRQTVFKNAWLDQLQHNLESWMIPEKNKQHIKSLLKKWSTHPDPNHQVWNHDEKLARTIGQFMDGKGKLEEVLNTDLIVLTDEKAENLEAEWRFGFWLCSLEYWLSYLERNEDEVRQELEDFSADLPFRMKKNVLVSYLPRAMTGVQIGYQWVDRSEHGKTTHVIKMFAYEAVGRELLYQWPSFFEHAGLGPGPSVVLLSGTTLSPVNTPYTLSWSPQWLLRSPNQSERLDQMLWNKTQIKISGQPLNQRVRNLKSLTRSIMEEIPKEMERWKKEGRKRRILCVVNSYDDCEVVRETLQPLMIRDGLNIHSLAKESVHPGQITRSELIQQASSSDVLIAPIGALNRGVNLVDPNGKALFGTAFFLARPYPSPENVEFMLIALHSLMDGELERIQRSRHASPLAKLKKLRRTAHVIFQDMIATPDYWSGLPEQKRNVLAWVLFVNVWQMIGRLVRGGEPARVYYCDASFYEPSEHAPTILEVWQRLLSESNRDEYRDLYGPFTDSLNKLLSHRWADEEEEEFG